MRQDNSDEVFWQVYDYNKSTNSKNFSVSSLSYHQIKQSANLYEFYNSKLLITKNHLWQEIELTDNFEKVKFITKNDKNIDVLNTVKPQASKPFINQFLKLLNIASLFKINKFEGELNLGRDSFLLDKKVSIKNNYKSYYLSSKSFTIVLLSTNNNEVIFGSITHRDPNNERSLFFTKNHLNQKTIILYDHLSKIIKKVSWFI